MPGSPRPPDEETGPSVAPGERHSFTFDGERSEPALDGLADPVLAVDESGVLVYASRRAEDVLAWSVEDLLGQSVLDLVHPDDLNIVLTSIGTVKSKAFGDLLRIRVRSGRGTWLYLEVRGAIQHLGDDEVIVLVARDITDRHQLDFDQGDVAVLRSVMNNMHGMVVLVTEDGRIRTINAAVTRLLGHDPELIRNQRFGSFLHDDDLDQVLDAIEATPPNTTVSFDARLRAADGAHHVCEFTVNNLLDDPVVASYIISAQMANSLVDARDRVDFLADHDSRTGLLNRDGFMKAARSLIDQGGGLGILVLDIIHFRSINELYGEPVGDAVLTAVAERLDAIRWPDLQIARFGGDEFVLAVRSSAEASIGVVRDRVVRDVSQPIVVDGQEVNFAIRTAAAFEARPQTLEALLVSASNELMSVKRHADPNSGGISFDAINARRAQLDQLRTALTNGEIQAHFQPIVDRNAVVTAVEALVRWTHPVRGVLGVGEILPLAQMAGLAEAVDDRMLEMSLDFARRLCADGRHDVSVHVNVDPKVIGQPSFAQSFLERCHRTGTNPSQMAIEITETDLLSPGVAALANMQRLRRAGTHVSIDDFGTGYSSLAHLLELPVDGVKIDRRFVAGIDVDPAATNLTTAILGLSDSLRLTCVAEGVEQPYQRDRLIERGCTAFQGWLYAPALPPDDVMALLSGPLTDTGTTGTAPASSRVPTDAVESD